MREGRAMNPNSSWPSEIRDAHASETYTWNFPVRLASDEVRFRGFTTASTKEAQADRETKRDNHMFNTNTQFSFALRRRDAFRMAS